MHRVLIVDDSETSRRVLSAILSADADVEVVGFAQNGREAIEKAQLLCPSVITMDLQMPILDGMEATKEIMIQCPTPIVIVSADPHAKDAERSMQALRAGALTVMLKPVGPHSPDFAAMSKEIVSTVKAMAGVMVIRHRRPKEKSVNASALSSTEAILTRPQSSVGSKSNAVRAIAIVASTGGPPALAKVLQGLPDDFSVPIFLVQHIVPSFMQGFASWLDSVVPLSVTIAEDEQKAQPSNVYVAPPDRHLSVTRGGRIQLSDDPPIGGFRPAGSRLFASMADSFGKDALGVILTGMGRDGVDGLKQLYDAGGYTIAQDEATSVVFGMPRAAIEESVVTTVLPLEKIGGHLRRLTCEAPR